MRSGAKRTSYDGLHTVNASERNAPQATESDSHARLRVYKVRCAATLVPNVFITLSPLLYLPRTVAQCERLHFGSLKEAARRRKGRLTGECGSGISGASPEHTFRDSRGRRRCPGGPLRPARKCGERPGCQDRK